MRIEAIDVGSNSIHMLVAQVEPEGHFRVLDRAKEMVRLGRRSLTTGKLTRAAMEQGIRTLTAFRTLAERQGVTRFRAVATSAVREARNGGEFLQQVKEQVGLRVKVIPGREEARLVWIGVANSIDLRGEPAVIVDAGGGSLEVIAVDGGQPIAMSSLKLGVARLSEMFLDADPPSAKALRRLREHLDEQLRPTLEPLVSKKFRHVIGTSGTMLTLIAMAAHRLGVHPGNPYLHNLEVPASAVLDLHETLSGSARARRSRMKGVDAKRVDQIVTGAALAERVIRTLEADRITACTWALREGLLLDYVARHTKGIEESARFTDVRRRSVMRLLRRLGYTGQHHHQVARLALRLFDQLHGPLGLDPSHRDLLEYAALLHDVGHSIAHENHHLHSYYLIVHGELLGFAREEIEVIGQVARLHNRKGQPKNGSLESVPLSRERKDAVRALAAILRLAEGLDRSQYGVVQDVKVRRRSGRVLLELLTHGLDAQLEVWEAGRRSELLEKLLGAPVGFRVSTAT
jgi:exopolyphosphatase/guanosine-5'-triphosphate,3'-diphosphate pyrophosphatase